MRTTLTIEDQLAAELKKRAFESGRSFKEVVNESLRRGLSAERRIRPSPPYRLKAVSLGGPLPGVNLDKALHLAELLEDEALRDKLEMRK
ncbi:MAG: DUF2191 domain-containing protein [Acidobacteriota bacterium]